MPRLGLGVVKSVAECLDILAEVLPKAHQRGMKVYCWAEDVFREDLPGIQKLQEVDWQGRRASTLCPLNPDYRNFVIGLTEDYCQSYEIDGLMWGSERQGPLHNAISARHGGRADPSRVTCFCELHQQAAKERGIEFKRARQGFEKLDQFIRGARANERPNDGYFVEFWRLLLDYPEPEQEQQVVANWDAGFNSRRLDQVDIQPLAEADAVSRCRVEVSSARMEPGVQRYAVDIVRRTRTHPFIHYGASPRASVALLLCSKALAAIRGREFSTPDDIRDVARPVLRHRLALRAEAELDGATPDVVISDILKSAEVPR